jgi:hypothetical protein
MHCPVATHQTKIINIIPSINAEAEVIMLPLLIWHT